MIEKNLESPLESKEVKQDNFKGNQPWLFLGRTNAEALILWPSDANSWLTGKDPDAGNDWRQEKRTTEDETFGRHYQFNGQELGHTPGDCEGQGSLVCIGSWRVRHNLATEQLVLCPQVWSFKCSVEKWSHFFHKRKGDIGFINCFSFKATSFKPKLRQCQISECDTPRSSAEEVWKQSEVLVCLSWHGTTTSWDRAKVISVSLF